jgi:hypothetical protein
MYGANPSNADFLDKLYHNVLHRAGDTAGFDWWLGRPRSGANTQAQCWPTSARARRIRRR